MPNIQRTFPESGLAHLHAVRGLRDGHRAASVHDRLELLDAQDITEHIREIMSEKEHVAVVAAWVLVEQRIFAISMYESSI
jgi:NADP-dependent 3-hydroxy acid dehydrogenase YdfG